MLLNLISRNTISRPDCYKIARRGRGKSRGHRHGRGSNGQKSRSGWAKRRHEGGQFSSYLRINKVGFTYKKNNKISIVKTSDINKILKSEQSIQKLDRSSICKYAKINEKSKYKILFDEAILRRVSVEGHSASSNVIKDKNFEFIKV